MNKKGEKIILSKKEKSTIETNIILNNSLIPTSIKRVRKDWEKIQNVDHLKDDEDSEIYPEDVSRLLIEFLKMNIECKIKKPSSNELTAMFPLSCYDEENKESKKKEPGVQITPYLRYGSLPINIHSLDKKSSKVSNRGENDDDERQGVHRKFYAPPEPHMKQYWKCGWCQAFEGVIERPEALHHLEKCKIYQSNLINIQKLQKENKKMVSSDKAKEDVIIPVKKEEKSSNNEAKVEERLKPSSSGETISSDTPPRDYPKDPKETSEKVKTYHCPSCHQEIIIKTPADILRHRKTCLKK